MATSRKGSTTPKELKEDAGGLVAGGGPDLSGTASQPVQSDATKPRSRTASTRKASVDPQPAAASTAKPKAKPATKGGSNSAAPATPSEAGDGASSGQAGTPQAADKVLPPAPGAQATDRDGRLSDEERQRRIAERAYRKAQERGFVGDRQLDDWLEAEREHNEAEGRSE